MKKLTIILLALVTLSSCEKEFVPKPRGYFRIDLPEKKYDVFEANCPLQFEAPAYSQIQVFSDHSTADSCWFNLFFPRNNAHIYCTYLPVKDNIMKLADDAYQFAFKHEMKADGIQRTYIEDTTRNVFGIIYDIQGEAASQVQFFLTDSVNHYLRGALYFDNKPNQDSLAPVLAFIREDIMHLTNTLQWK
jgi:gliding motility-associated lipoprotein GldD